MSGKRLRGQPGRALTWRTAGCPELEQPRPRPGAPSSLQPSLPLPSPGHPHVPDPACLWHHPLTQSVSRAVPLERSHGPSGFSPPPPTASDHCGPCCTVGHSPCCGAEAPRDPAPAILTGAEEAPASKQLHLCSLMDGGKCPVALVPAMEAEPLAAQSPTHLGC